MQISVDNWRDSVDLHPGDGSCVDSEGLCSLRAAIMEANAVEPGSVITLHPADYWYHVMFLSGAPEDDGVSGDLDIYNSMTISGPEDRSQRVQIEFQFSQSYDGGFHIHSATDINVTIRNLVIDGGYRDPGIAQGLTTGGNVLADGTGVHLTLQNVVLSNGFASRGGGIGAVNGAQVIIDRSTLENNFGEFSSGGLEVTAATATVKNSTLTANYAARDSALAVRAGGVVTINNATIASNYALSFDPGTVSGIRNVDGTVQISNSIVAQNSVAPGDLDANCGGDISSTGDNLVSAGNNCQLAAGDLVADPRLLWLPMRFAPGYTLELAPQEGSPVLDAGTTATCEPMDQRGAPRPDGISCDIGAYEGYVASEITNGGFELAGNQPAVPAGWKTRNLTRDRRLCNKEGKPPIAYEGECAFRFKTPSDASSLLVQRFKFKNSDWQDNFVLNFALYGVGQGYLNLDLEFKTTSAARGSSRISVGASQQGYELWGTGGTMAAPLKKIILKIYHVGQESTFLVDGLYLVTTAEKADGFSLPVRIPPRFSSRDQKTIQAHLRKTNYKMMTVTGTVEDYLLPVPPAVSAENPTRDLAGRQ